HRGSNWNALMAGTTPSLQIVFAKAAVISVLAAIMQAIAVVTGVVLEEIGFGLPGSLPPDYLAVSLVIILAGVRVPVLQSWLSMQMRSFAAPVAVAFLGAGFSAFLLVGGLDAAIFISPYAVLSRATQLGTATFA